MATISAFADEIGESIDEQVATLKQCGVRFIELRTMDGVPVLELTDEHCKRIKTRLDDEGMAVSSISSPIGKVKIDEPFAPHLDQFKRAVELAQSFGAKLIRIFSYYPPGGGDIADHRNEVMDRMAKKVELVEGTDIVIGHENESDIYGTTADRCVDIIEAVNSPKLRAIYDAANFVIYHDDPHAECWPKIKPHLAYFHIKDKVKDGPCVPYGEGDGNVLPTMREAAEMGFDGFMTLEPHLSKAGQFRGFSGPHRFVQAADALKKVCREAGLAYE